MRILYLAISLLFVYGCAMAQGDIATSFGVDKAGQRVELPYVPTEIDFAGERVPLDREDVRNALVNEMLVTKYMHSKTMKSLLETRRYFKIIEPILKEQGIPDDFKYLAIAESSLDPTAYSYAKAAGLWQILAGTATDQKLEVNSSVDERYNIEKSTIVACKYFKKAYAKFGSWSMAAASYNVGMAGLSRRANSQKEDNFYNLFLPTETMRYLHRIITYKVLCEQPEKLGFYLNDSDYYKDFNYKEVEVSDAVIDWVALAKKHGTTYKSMRALNNWIRLYSHSNKYKKKYTVKIPQ